MNRYIWGGVGVVLLAYVLMAFVQEFLPVFVVVAVMVGIYRLVFKKHW